MTISDAITDYFRKNWKDLTKQIGFHANLVADHSVGWSDKRHEVKGHPERR